MKLFVILGILFFFSAPSYAWGPKGQEITVIVTENYLSPVAKSQISALIGANKRLSQFASWADQVRSTEDWNFTGSWHYINVSDRGDIETSGDLETPQDVAAAIDFCVGKLKSKGTNKEEKLAWLKFLIHLVGDIHQPMHVGRAEDRGGNSTQVFYGKEMNLHFLWDSAFLQKNSLSSQNYFIKLKSEIGNTSELVKPFLTDVTIKENFKLRKFIYSFNNGVIDSSYERQAIAIVNERVWTGGVRLASLLNSIYK